MNNTENKTYTPLQAIGARCYLCSYSNYKERANCKFTSCDLYPYRKGHHPKPKIDTTTKKSIRKYCLWCMCGQVGEVRKCPSTECPLYSYRGSRISKKCPAIDNNSISQIPEHKPSTDSEKTMNGSNEMNLSSIKLGGTKNDD